MIVVQQEQETCYMDEVLLVSNQHHFKLMIMFVCNAIIIPSH